MITTRDLAKAVESITRRHDTWRVWCDFMQLSATAIANAVDMRHQVWQSREDAYLQTVQNYNKDEVNAFAKALAMVVEGLGCEEPGDLLGQTYMQLELGNKWAGQFFTPDSLCRVMAAVTMHNDDIKQRIEQNGFVTVSEPSVGGGATVIALANELKRSGINYQQSIHVTAVDVDIKSVHMAYIQFSLLHIPAVVIHGNSLSCEEWSHWYTPAHIMGNWNWRLKNRDTDHIPDTKKMVSHEPPKPIELVEQISLL